MSGLVEVPKNSISLFGHHVHRGTMRMKLTPMIITSSKKIEEIFDAAHDLFKKTICSKDRPYLGNKEIYVPLIWMTDRKAEIFWHVSSLEQKARLDIKPCTNDITSAICDSNCIKGPDTIVLTNGEERTKCIYRTTRIGWIMEIVKMYNSSDVRVKYWEKDIKGHRRRIYLRYQEEEVDYLVVFEKKGEKRVVLITGYPVFFISAKNDLDKEYTDYLKSLTK